MYPENGKNKSNERPGNARIKNTVAQLSGVVEIEPPRPPQHPRSEVHGQADPENRASLSPSQSRFLEI